jgi:hypothetical protein
MEESKAKETNFAIFVPDSMARKPLAFAKWGALESRPCAAASRAFIFERSFMFSFEERPFAGRNADKNIYFVLVKRNYTHLLILPLYHLLLLSVVLHLVAADRLSRRFDDLALGKTLVTK